MNTPTKTSKNTPQAKQTKQAKPAGIVRLLSAAALALHLLPPATAAAAAHAAPQTGQGGQSGQSGQSGTASQSPQSNQNTSSSSQNSTTGQTGQTNGSGGSGSLPGTNPTPDDPHFDLARTMRDAQTSSSDLAQARRNVQITQKENDAAEARVRPSVSGTARATRYDQATSVAFGGQLIPVLPDHTEDLALTISQRLDLLGDVRATRSQIKLDEAADRYELDRLTNDRILTAKTTYYDLLRATHQTQVAQSALRNAQEQLSISTRLYLGQIGAHIDVLSASTKVAQARRDLTKAENDRDVARQSFNDLVGRPLTAPVTLEDTPGVTVGVDLPPSVAASAPVGAAPTNAPAFTPFAPPTADVNGIDVEKSVTAALTLRPEILRETVRTRAAETGIRIARSDLNPTFDLSASGDYYPTTSFQNPRQRTASLTATITIPFYDGGATRARVAQAKLRRDNAQTTLDSTRSDVSVAVRKAYLNLLTAVRQIAAANAALEEAVATRQLAQVRYEGQVGLYLEVTDAQAALVRSENDQVDAVYDYFVARARFDNAVGAP